MRVMKIGLGAEGRYCFEEGRYVLWNAPAWPVWPVWTNLVESELKFVGPFFYNIYNLKIINWLEYNIIVKQKLF